MRRPSVARLPAAGRRLPPPSPGFSPLLAGTTCTNLPQGPATGADDDYQREVAEMVTEETPVLFAVVEDLVDRSDGRIAAWMLEFPDRAEVISVDGGLRMSVPSTDRALAIFGRQPGVTARLVPSGRPQD